MSARPVAPGAAAEVSDHLPHRPAGPQKGEEILLDTPAHSPDLTPTAASADLACAIAKAAASVAQLDQALGAARPLRLAFLHRARLEAVHRQAVPFP